MTNLSLLAAQAAAVLALAVTSSYSVSLNGLGGFRPTASYPSNAYQNNHHQQFRTYSNINQRQYQSHPSPYNSQYGSYYQQNRAPGVQDTLLLRWYCQNRNTLQKNFNGGYIMVYCIRDEEYLKTVLSSYSQQGHGLTGNQLGQWFSGKVMLQASGMVPVCILKCLEGMRLMASPGNYTQPLSTSVLSVGCSNIISPRCYRVCSNDVYTLDNGIVFCTMDTHVGTTCTAHCKPGYTLVGPSSKTCGIDLQWNNTNKFNCYADHVASAVKNLMKSESLSVDAALAKLLYMVETHLRTRPAPSTAQGEVQQADLELTKVMESLLIDISKSTSISLKSYSVCSMKPKDRFDCGYRGITYETCKSRNCCWDDSEINTIWCFHKDGYQHANFTTKYTTKHPEDPYTMFNNLMQQEIIQSSTRFTPQNGVQSLPAILQPQHDAITPDPFSQPFIPNPGAVSPTENQCGCVQPQVSRCLPTPQARVFCGNYASATQWPWHTIVFYGDKKLCGGTLISRNFVLTAAHCVSPSNRVSEEAGEVFLGVTRRDIEDPKKQKRKMKMIIRHPLFYARGDEVVQNDIALIQLSHPVDITSSVRPLCLPGSHRPSVGKKCFITGFGKQSPTSTASIALQVAPIPVVSSAQCKKIYDKKVNSEQNLCAGELGAQASDACKGDSGGPLACQVEGENNGCSWYLAGVTSFGTEPCGSGWPGVYVNVAHYQSWINSHLARGRF